MLAVLARQLIDGSGREPLHDVVVLVDGERIATDAGFLVYHGQNAGELEELVKGGFTPMEAIVATTRVGAECLDLDRDVGTIEPGKYADLVIIDGDPLADIRILQDEARIVQVFKGGKKIDV